MLKVNMVFLMRCSRPTCGVSEFVRYPGAGVAELAMNGSRERVIIKINFGSTQYRGASSTFGLREKIGRREKVFIIRQIKIIDLFCIWRFAMNKAFRMKYEPCDGACYVAPDVVNLSFLAENLVELRNIINKLIRAHEPLCGNQNVAYGIDYDDKNKVFVASFLHYGKLDLFCQSDLLSVLHELCDRAIAHFDSPEGKRELESSIVSGHDVCEHGKDDELLVFMIKNSGIPTPNGVDAFINEMRHA